MLFRSDGGPAIEATIAAPHELLFDKAGDLYFAERDNNVIRKVNMKTGIISTVAGTGKAGFAGDGGPGTQAVLNQPHSIFLDRDGTINVETDYLYLIEEFRFIPGVPEAIRSFNGP